MNLHMIDISPFLYTGIATRPSKISIGYVNQDDKLYNIFLNYAGLQFLFKTLSQIKFNYSKDEIILFQDRYYNGKIELIKTLTKAEDSDLEHYKQDRTHDDLSDISVLRKVVEVLFPKYGYNILYREGFEADDTMYTYWKYNKHKYNNIFVYSQDIDMFMLVDRQTSIHPVNSRGKVITLENYSEVIAKDMLVPWNLSSIYRLCFKNKDGIAHIGNNEKWGVWELACKVEDKSIFSDSLEVLKFMLDLYPNKYCAINTLLALPLDCNESSIMSIKEDSKNITELSNFISEGEMSQPIKDIVYEIFGGLYGRENITFI